MSGNVRGQKGKAAGGVCECQTFGMISVKWFQWNNFSEMISLCTLSHKVQLSIETLFSSLRLVLYKTRDFVKLGPWDCEVAGSRASNRIISESFQNSVHPDPINASDSFNLGTILSNSTLLESSSDSSANFRSNRQFVAGEPQRSLLLAFAIASRL